MSPLSVSEYTPQEALKVLDRAIELIRRPDTWVKGAWKCPVSVVNQETHQRVTGLAPNAHPSPLAQKVDEQGRPIYAYCLEGAINQATLDVLGVVRAIQVGAISDSAVHRFGGIQNEITNDHLRTGERASTNLSLAALSEKLFSSVLAVRTYIQEKRSAGMPAHQLAMVLNDAPETTHEDVMRILRTRREQVARQVGAP